MDLASIVCRHDGIYVRSSSDVKSLAKVIGAGHSMASKIVTTRRLSISRVASLDHGLRLRLPS